MRAVKSLNILDTQNEERFDAITRAAAKHLKAPMCAISIVDDHREFYKSRVGIEPAEGQRDESFCGHTIVEGKIFIVEDTRKDPRFVDNPQVDRKRGVRFYAGVTLHDDATHMPVGAFCIKDTKPRKLSMEELNALLDYAARAERELNTSLRRPDQPSG